MYVNYKILETDSKAIIHKGLTQLRCVYVSVIKSIIQPEMDLFPKKGAYLICMYSKRVENIYVGIKIIKS